MNIKNELIKAIPYLGFNWKKQTNYSDFKTNFIYNCFSFDELLNEVSFNNLDRDYTIHRWYNFHTSKISEDIFVSYGAVRESNPTNKKVDFYYKNINYDLKLTVLPRTYKEFLDLKKRKDKDKLISWLYKNQSQQGRKHLENRLFIVCYSKDGDYIKSLALKSNFNLIEFKIKQFVEYYEKNDLNQTTIIDDNKEIKVYSDIIFIQD